MRYWTLTVDDLPQPPPSVDDLSGTGSQSPSFPPASAAAPDTSPVPESWEQLQLPAALPEPAAETSDSEEELPLSARAGRTIRPRGSGPAASRSLSPPPW